MKLRAIGYLTLGAAAVLAWFAVETEVTGGSPHGPMSEDMAQAQEVLDQALARVEDGTAEAEAQDIAGQFGLEASGDICLMRHGRLALRVPAGLRQKLAAIEIATTPDMRLTLLDAVAVDQPDSVVAWRVHMLRAKAMAQAGDRDGAGAALDAAAGVTRIDLRCRSDEAVARAALGGDPARVTALLDAAVVADPGNWQAQVRRVLFATSQIGRGDPAACARDAARVIEGAVVVAALTGSARQLDRLGAAARTQASGAALAILEGMMQERSGRAARAAETYALGLSGPRPAGECGLVLTRAIEARLTAVTRDA